MRSGEIVQFDDAPSLLLLLSPLSFSCIGFEEVQEAEVEVEEEVEEVEEVKEVEEVEEGVEEEEGK